MGRWPSPYGALVIPLWDGGGSYYDIIDATPDCIPLPGEGQVVRLVVGALRAYLKVCPQDVGWDDPYHPGGTRSPRMEDEKMGIVLKDDPNGIKSLTPTLSEGEGEWYDLSGRQMVNGKWQNGKLPQGIYIKEGKKIMVR